MRRQPKSLARQAELTPPAGGTLAREASRETYEHDDPDKVYLRFGRWPENERSHNFATGTDEDGVSAYELSRHGDPMDPDPTGYSRHHFHDEGCEPYCDLDRMNEHYGETSPEGRVTRAERARAYGREDPDDTGHLVKGELAGFGHDAEPLLRNVRRVGDWIDHRHLFLDQAQPHRLARHPSDEGYEEPGEKPPYGYRNEHTAAATAEPEDQDYWISHRPPGPGHNDQSGRPQPSIAYHEVTGRDPDDLVDVYRGAPEGAATINPGDWVTLHGDWARDRGEHVLHARVPARHVYLDAKERDDDEAGYHGPAITATASWTVRTASREEQLKAMDPRTRATALAQEEMRLYHPMTAMPLDVKNGQSSVTLSRWLGDAGHPRAGDAFVAVHGHPADMHSQTARGPAGQPVVALHPDRWDYGTLAHEAAHLITDHQTGRPFGGDHGPEGAHGPQWARNYAGLLNQVSKGAGGHFISLYRQHAPAQHQEDQARKSAEWRAAHEPQQERSPGMIYLSVPHGTLHALPGGMQRPEGHHLTVAHLPRDMDDDQHAEVLRHAAKAAAASPPLEGTLGGMETFPRGAGPETRRVAFVPARVPGVERLHSDLAEVNTSPHEDYQPHVTVSYLRKGEQNPGPHPQVPVRFTHLHVERDGQVTSFPLTGNERTAVTAAVDPGWRQVQQANGWTWDPTPRRVGKGYDSRPVHMRADDAVRDYLTSRSRHPGETDGEYEQRKRDAGRSGDQRYLERYRDRALKGGPVGADPSAPRYDPDEIDYDAPIDWGHPVNRHEAAAGEGYVPPQMPPRQLAAHNQPDFMDYRRDILAAAKDPEPGTVVWRSEQRPKGENPHPASVGIHWTLNPDQVIHMPDTDTHHTVVYQGRVTDPAAQAFPRSHPMWAGQHRSMDSEAEVRLRPGTSVHVEGAWTPGVPSETRQEDGSWDQRDRLVPMKPERMTPGHWHWNPVNADIPVRHAGQGYADYSDVGIHREAAAEFSYHYDPPRHQGDRHVITVHHPDAQRQTRMGPSDVAASMQWDDDVIRDIDVHPEFRRRGIATELFRRARQVTPGLRHADNPSPDARQWIDGMQREAAAEPVYYHGSADQYQPGDQIEHHFWKKYPDRADFRENSPLYTTTDPSLAGHIANLRGGAEGHVYEVRPTGDLRPDELANGVVRDNASWEVRAPLHVVREIPRSEWPQDLNSWHMTDDEVRQRREDEYRRRHAVSGYDGLTGRSGMIYLDLPPGTVRPVPGGVDDHHVTICYLGKNVSDEAFEEACHRTRAAAAKLAPMDGVLRGIDVFPPSKGSDGKVVAFVPAYVGSVGLLRRELEDLSASEHTDWRPHVTLGYLEEGDSLPAPHPAVPLRFTRVHVKRGDEVRSFPLGGNPGKAASASGPWYHGTAHDFQAGDLVTTGQPVTNSRAQDRLLTHIGPGRTGTYNHATSDPDVAVGYARRAANASAWRGEDRPPRVYRVEFSGEHEPDPDGGPDDRRSAHPLQVLGEVPEHEVHRLMTQGSRHEAAGERPTFYHGSGKRYPDGHVIDPSQPHKKLYPQSDPAKAYFSDSLWNARNWANTASPSGKGHVYEVEPTGDYEDDPHYAGPEENGIYDLSSSPIKRINVYQTGHPLHVVRRVPPEGEMIREAASGPEFFHGSRHDLAPGTHLTPDGANLAGRSYPIQSSGKHVYYTDDMGVARAYGPKVYRVKPLAPPAGRGRDKKRLHDPEPGFPRENEYLSTHGFEVIGRVPDDEAGAAWDDRTARRWKSRGGQEAIQRIVDREGPEGLPESARPHYRPG